MRLLKQLFNRYSIIITFIIILNCAKDDQPDKELNYRRSEFIEFDYSNFSNNVSPFEIASQLNDHIDGDDYFLFNFNEKNENALCFASVHEFIKFKNNHYLDIFNYEIIHFNDYYITLLRDVYNNIMAIELKIIQKLYDEEMNLNYTIIDIRSRISGEIFGRSWEQLSFTYSIFNGTAIIELKGTLHYELIIANYGILFKDFKNYKIILDIHTGIPVSFIEA